jgi:peptidoglycan/LPS O-acetylase OafA/YrhL
MDASISSRAPGPDDGPPAGPGRVDALDRLRGVALLGMVIHHATDWMTGNARTVLPGWPSFALTDVAAVAFFVAAGASMCLFVASRRQRGVRRTVVAGQVLRRYGLLVPIGLTLDWVLWRNPSMFGVLEALGMAVVVGAAVAAVVPDRLLPLAAVAALAGGVWSERVADGHDAWIAREVISGKFPLVTYVGFVLVGVAAVRTGRYADRRWALGAAVLAGGATLVMVADGIVPARYPGNIPFVVPGLAGTAVVYALAQLPWSGPFVAVDRLVRRAAAHTLGIFVAHYLVYALLRQQGLLGTVQGAVAVPVALVVTVGLCLVAPRVPQLPWSARTGWRRRPPPEQPAEVTPTPGPAAEATVAR